MHYGQVEAIKLLLSYGLRVSQTDNRGWTPLHVACTSRHPNFLEVVRLLLSQGKQDDIAECVHTFTASGNSVLHYYAENTMFAPVQSVSYMKTLIEFIDKYNLDCNLQNNYGDTPLHYAAQSGNTVSLLALVKRTPLVHVKNQKVRQSLQIEQRTLWSFEFSTSPFRITPSIQDQYNLFYHSPLPLIRALIFFTFNSARLSLLLVTTGIQSSACGSYLAAAACDPNSAREGSGPYSLLSQRQLLSAGEQ